MLNSIVYAINVLKALNTLSSNEYLNEWKQPKDPSEVETVIPWDWYWDEEPADAAAAAAPSWFLSFDDLHCCVVNGFQSFVEPALSFGPWLLPFLSLLVGMCYVLGFRPFERLNGLSGIWRCAVAMINLVVSFLAVWTTPAVVIKACVVALLIRVALGLARGAWHWIWWTLHRLVDLLGSLLFLGLFVREEINMVTITGLIGLWAGCRKMLYVARFYLPMSWLCAAERACSSLTFPLVMNLRLVWWAIRNVLALVWMAVVKVCGAAVVGATGAANTVQAICGSFKGMVPLSFVQVCDLVSVEAPVPAAGEEATGLPVAVEDAPAAETEGLQVELSTANAAVVSEIPVKARAKSKVPKGLVQSKSRRRARPTQESQVEPRRSKRITDRKGR
jgi:hypothetical protein